MKEMNERKGERDKGLLEEERKEKKNAGERHAHAAARPEARDSTDLCVRKVE